MSRWGAILLVAAGCSFQHGSSAAPMDTVDAPPGTVADGMVDAPLPAWGTPTPIASLPGADDPTLTDDLLELYFNSNNDIYLMTRLSTASAWSTPTVVAQLSSAYTETTPEVSYDGLTMMFASDRPGSKGSTDLWISTRASRSAAWGTPVVISELNTATSEAGPVMTPDGKTIVFTSYVKANLSPDVYLSERASVGAAWGASVEVTALNTDFHEGSAFITADKRWIYFDTDRDGGLGLDLYYSHRASPADPFPAPQPLTELDSPTTDEQDPWLSLDQRHLVFYSDRGGMPGLWESVR